MLAERDYEIRNRTVHTKEGFDELGPLLPFNPEVETPDHDTALVRFLAKETHRSGSSTRPSERLTVP
ncbi:MAG: hypothetical protein WKF95_05580, partial [Rubrobacter sp.]